MSLDPGDDKARADLAASFQQTVARTLASRVGQAISAFKDRYPEGRALVAAGGVAANSAIRGALTKIAIDSQLRLVVPPPKLCTDNGAMVAWAGLERLRLGLTDGFDFAARPRWPLDATAVPAAYAGVKA